MQAQFNQTEDDIIAFILVHIKYSPAAWRRWKIVALCLLFFGLALSLLFRDLQPLWMAGLLTVMFIGLVRVFPKMLFRKMAREGRNASLLGPRTVTISPEGVAEKTEVSESNYRWSTVERICTTDDYAFLYVSALSALIVPKRAFSAPSEFAAFVSEARKYADMAKQTITASSGEAM